MDPTVNFKYYESTAGTNKNYYIPVKIIVNI